MEQADIVLGVLSSNSAGTIANVVRAGQEALSACFPTNRGLLVHLDGGSRDETPRLALEAAIDKEAFLQISYPLSKRIDLLGIPSKADAYQAVFDVSEKMEAHVCVVVDGNTGSFQRDWVEALVRPVLEREFDWVSPCYQRRKYDGAILNGIVYPLLRALYGRRIRQPIGGDFAFSRKLIADLMRQLRADGNAGGFGVDVSVLTAVCRGNFRVAQACLGPRTLVHSGPAPEVSAILTDVLGSIFTEMNETAPLWQRIRNSEIVPIFGSGCESDEEVSGETAPVEVSPMIESFQLGFQNLQEIWRMVLSPATLVALKRMVGMNTESFGFEDAVWARVIYDFALAYRMRTIDRTHLLGALTPIYFGWLAAYVISLKDKGAKEAQDRMESLCLAYEEQKVYFISRWRWPDQFNP